MKDGIYEITETEEFTTHDNQQYRVTFKPNGLSYSATTEFDNLHNAGFDKVKKLAERNTHVVVRNNDIIAFAEMIK